MARRFIVENSDIKYFSKEENLIEINNSKANFNITSYYYIFYGWIILLCCSLLDVLLIVFFESFGIILISSINIPQLISRMKILVGIYKMK